MKTTLEEQIDTYADMVARHPEDVNNLMLYGCANLKTGRRLAALSAYQKVIEIDPENLLARNKLAAIYLEKDLLEEAYREVTFSLEQEPNNIEARFLLSLLQKSKAPSSEISERLDKIPHFHFTIAEIEDFIDKTSKEKEEVEELIKAYQDKLNTFPDDLYLEFDLQVCLRNKSNIEELVAFIKGVEEGEKKRQEEEEEKRRLEEEERRRLEEEERRILEEEEKRRLEEEEKRRLEEEERRRLEEEERRRLEEEERRRLEEEEERKLEEERLGKLGEIFGSKLDDFASHKMVSEVLLVHSTGSVVKCSQSFANENFADIVAEGVSFVKSWHPMDYWVIEYQQGLIFVKLIAKDLILVVIGGIGSNFGALRFVIDRNEKNLIGTLRNSEFSSLLDEK